MRIALLQESTTGPEALNTAARSAAAQGAGLLVTPELSMTGYALGDATEARAEPADGPGAVAVAGIAAAHGIAVVYGYPERGEDGAVHNAAQLVGADGSRLANYRKTHLYGPYERKYFTAGDRLTVQAELEGVRVGLLICYDVEFPEAVRAHALAGTELLLVPTALMRPYDVVARTLVPARAFESQLYVAYANREGREGDIDFAGLSCLASPDGAVPVRAGRGPELVFAEVDPGLPHTSGELNPYLADRRPELYGAGAYGAA